MAIVMMNCILKKTLLTFIVVFIFAVLFMTAPAAADSASIFADLGLNIDELPKGYNPADTLGLTGRTVTVTNPRFELVSLNLPGGTQDIYGHNKSLEGNTRDDNTPSSGASLGSISDYNVVSTSGNFDGNAATEGQVVYVRYNNGIKITITDPVTSLKTDDKVLYANDPSSGTKGIASGSFYNLNYLAVAAGDFDGDGCDEIAVYVPDASDPRIEFYDLIRDVENGGWKNWNNWGNNVPSWTYSLTMGSYVPNMVSLCAEDFTKDGIDDLAVSWGSYGSSESQCTASKIVLLEGVRSGAAGTEFLKAGVPFIPNNGNFYRGSLSHGVVTDVEMGEEKLIAAGSSTNNPKDTNRYIVVYYYERESGTFSVESETNYNYADFENYAGGLQPYVKTNVIAAKIDGKDNPSVIYCDSAYFDVDSGSILPREFIRKMSSLSSNGYIWSPVNVRAVSPVTGTGTPEIGQGLFELTSTNYYELNTIAMDLDGKGNESVMMSVYSTGTGTYTFTGAWIPFAILDDYKNIGDIKYAKISDSSQIDAMRSKSSNPEYNYQKILLSFEQRPNNDSMANYDHYYIRTLFVPEATSKRPYRLFKDTQRLDFIVDWYSDIAKEYSVNGWHRVPGIPDSTTNSSYEPTIGYWWDRSLTISYTDKYIKGLKADGVSESIINERKKYGNLSIYGYDEKVGYNGAKAYSYSGVDEDGRTHKYTITYTYDGEDVDGYRYVTPIYDEINAPHNSGSNYYTVTLDTTGYKKHVDETRLWTTANTDSDTIYTQYTGIHYLTHSAPEVLAVIASPPYFEDLAYDLDYMGSGTAFSQTITVGVETTNTKNRGGGYTHSVGGKIFAAKVEWETEFLAEVTWEKSKSYEMEQTIEYAVSAGEDAVAIYSIPTEYYVYVIYEPVYENNTWKYRAYLDDIQRTFSPATSVIPLDEYEVIRENYESGTLPKIKGEILKHTLGDPSTYPETIDESEYNDIIVTGDGYIKATKRDGKEELILLSDIDVLDKEDKRIEELQELYLNARTSSTSWSAVRFGSGEITQSVSYGRGASSSRDTTCSWGFEVAAGWEWELRDPVTALRLSEVSLAFGGTASRGFGSSKAKTTFVSESYSGTLHNMPADAENAGYYYAWKLFTYKEKYTNNGKTYEFPVVSYLVTDVSAPPVLPTDFQQDRIKSTSSENVLTWSYSADASEFVIYREYDFPDGGGSFVDGFVKANQYMRKETDENGNTVYYYEYHDTNLTAYTEYNYQLQVLRNSVPPMSILSPGITAKTKSSEGYPDIKINAVKDYYGNAVVYPDSTIVARVSVENSSGYNQGFWYQWQKKINGKWTDLVGATSDTLTRSFKGVELGGEYRVRINTLYTDMKNKEYAISAYSDTIKMVTEKRPVNIELTAEKLETGDTRLTARVSSAHPDYSGVPTGRVNFVVNIDGEDGKFPATLENGVATFDIVAEAFNDGSIYPISADYLGEDAYFNGKKSEIQEYLCGGVGHIIDIPNTMQYGEKHELSVSEVTGNGRGGITAKTPYGETVNYKIFDEDGVEVDTETFIPYEEFQSQLTGVYTIKAFNSTHYELATKKITITERPITIRAISYYSSTESTLPTTTCLNISEGALASWHTNGISSLNLTTVTKNSAGKTLSSDPKAGKYTITGAKTSTTPSGYAITFIPGTYIVRGETYKVNLTSVSLNGRTVGTVNVSSPAGEQSYEKEASIVVQAVPELGYAVDKWYIDDVEQVSNKGGEYLFFTMPDKTVNVKVTFKVAEARFVYKVSNENAGTINISNNLRFESGSKVLPGAELNFTAKPNDGWHFVEWRYLENSITNILTGTEDRNKNEYYVSLTTGTTSVVLTAQFERDTYSLTLSENLIANYTTVGGKNIIVNSGDKIPGDSEITVNPAAGYFMANNSKWKHIDESGEKTVKVLSNTTEQEYNFTILSDTVIEATPCLGTYKITNVNVSNAGSTASKYEIRVGDMLINETSLSDILGGTTIVITATPEWGYIVENIKVNGEVVETNPLELNAKTYEIEGINEDIQINITFAQNKKYNITVKKFLHAASEYSLNNNASVQLTPGVESGTQITTYAGDKLVITVTPDEGYLVYGHAKTWTLDNISKDEEIAFDLRAFAYNSVYFDVNGFGGNISATADDNNITNGDENVGIGSRLVFTAKPNENQMVQKWAVNGEPVLNEYDGLFIENEYVIKSFSEGVLVQVYFTPFKEHNVSYNTTQNNATIKEIYNHTLKDGKIHNTGTFVFNVTPQKDYKITNVTGLNLNEFNLTTDTDGIQTYVINNVTDNISVVVTTALDAFNITTPNLFKSQLTAEYSPDLHESGKVFNKSKATFTIVPDSDYTVFSVTNAGPDELVITKHGDGSWTAVIEKVSGDIAITAIAVKEVNKVELPENPTLTDKKTKVPAVDLDLISKEEFEIIKENITAPLMPEKNRTTVYMHIANISLYDSAGTEPTEIVTVSVNQTDGRLNLSSLISSDNYIKCNGLKITYSGRHEGDTNGDGVVNAADILMQILTPEKVDTLANYYGDMKYNSNTYGVVDYDGVFDERDYEGIAQIAVGV